MKPLHELSNTEKGKLLADLFPDELEGMVEMISGFSHYTINHKQEITTNWSNGFITPDFWCGLAAEVVQLINRHRYSMIRSSKVFSDQLFYGNTAVFTIDCIRKCAQSEGAPEKFKIAVDLLFDSHPLPNNNNNEQE
ncbi:hypothetical protein [Pedobacter nutrimenti]|uniref:hypothetical protein n=1 Tax=Pedobacter nutrimenti TaxID=1241337 RepID=UPI00292F8D17|nr:hypothetical protein [Pedobacter nutrimenti]